MIHLSPEQLEGHNLAAVEVRAGSVTPGIELPAELQWNGDQLVHVSPRVSGIVARVEKTLGDRVQAGELLCVLDSREIGDAKMEYLADTKKFAVAAADFDRAKTVHENTKKLLDLLEGQPSAADALSRAHDLPVGVNKNRLLTAYTRMRVTGRNFETMSALAERKIASELDLLEARGEHETARADYLSTLEEVTFNLKLDFLRAERDFKVGETEVQNSERALHVLGLTDEQITAVGEGNHELEGEISTLGMRSPISGIIVERHLTRGERVEPGTRLYTIADTSDVWVLGRVYERDVRFLREGQKALVRLDAFPGETFEGTIAYVGSEIRPETRTLEARVVLPNGDGRFRAGMFGSVTVFRELDAGEYPGDGYVVPVSALQRVEEGHAVYAVEGPGMFREVPVKVLAKSRDFAQVDGELEPGMRVATGDTFLLKSEADKESMGGGHAH